MEIEILQELGFSANEAKVYITLLKRSPMNGYEIAQKSKITRTMIYDIISRLLKKDAIIEVNGENKLYVPVPYKELIKRMKENYNSNLNLLESRLEKISLKDDSISFIHNIADRETMIERIKNFIGEAKEEIYISVWLDEAKLFEKELRAAADRGVKIIIFSFCGIPFEFSTNHTYNLNSEELHKQFSRRRMLFIFDRAQMAIGEGNEKIDEVSFITSNKMFVQLATDLIILDIIHLYSLKNQGLIKPGMKMDEYIDAVMRYQSSIGLPAEMPKF